MVVFAVIFYSGFVLGLFLAQILRNIHPRREYQMSTHIVVDATRPIKFKNPVVKIVKDIEGSPKQLESPLPVLNYSLSIAPGAIGAFGEVVDNGDGTFTFDPGNEITEQAEGTLFGTGQVDFEGQLVDVQHEIFVELEPGKGASFGEIEPELEIV